MSFVLIHPDRLHREGNRKARRMQDRELYHDVKDMKKQIRKKEAWQ